MEGYLDQVYRSKVKVTRAKTCFTGVFCLVELDGSMRLHCEDTSDEGDEDNGTAAMKAIKSTGMKKPVFLGDTGSEEDRRSCSGGSHPQKGMV